MKYTVFLLFVLSTTILYAQLVNIESQRVQSDSIRFSGNVNLNFSYQKNNGKPLTQFKSSLVLQAKSKSLKDIVLILGSYQYSKTRDQQLSNSAFGHIRYNRKLNDIVRYELFTQIQNNELINLRSRFITGTGFRFKLNRGEWFKVYIGIASFYEYEESIEAQRVFRNDFRMSDYLVLSFILPKSRGEITSTTYYQPLYDRFSDFRLSNQTLVVLNISERISFTTSFEYSFDQNPPIGIARETIGISNGLRLKI